MWKPPLSSKHLGRALASGLPLRSKQDICICATQNLYNLIIGRHQFLRTSFEKNCFSAWASTLNMGLINKVDMVCLSPVGYGV